MPVDITVAAILSDMDGSLIDSTPAVEKTLKDWCLLQGLDPIEFFKHSHGVRTRDNIKRWQRIPLGSTLSEDEITETVNKLEASIAENGRLLALAGGRGIEALPGAAKLLQDLRDHGARFGIVTSATLAYASSALKTSGIVPPTLPFLVTAELCLHGKPHPEPYLNGLKQAALLPGPAFNASNVLVIEDAPSGLTSGLAAGCKTLAVCTGGQPMKTMLDLEATHKVIDLTRVELISVVDGMITLRLHELHEEKTL